MYQLERRGIQAVHVDREEIDLWVRTLSGRVLTIQVKAASASRPGTHGNGPSYKFYRPQNTTADLVALVALDAEVVLIFEPKDVPNTITPRRVTREEMERSIAEHLA